MKWSLFIITLMFTLFDWCAIEAIPTNFADSPAALDATVSRLDQDSVRADTGQSKTPSSGIISDNTASGIDPLPVGSTGQPEIFSEAVIQFATFTVSK